MTKTQIRIICIVAIVALGIGLTIPLLISSIRGNVEAFDTIENNNKPGVAYTEFYDSFQTPMLYKESDVYGLLSIRQPKILSAKYGFGAAPTAMYFYDESRHQTWYMVGDTMNVANVGGASDTHINSVGYQNLMLMASAPDQEGTADDVEKYRTAYIATLVSEGNGQKTFRMESTLYGAEVELRAAEQALRGGATSYTLSDNTVVTDQNQIAEKYNQFYKTLEDEYDVATRATPRENSALPHVKNVSSIILGVRKNNGDGLGEKTKYAAGGIEVNGNLYIFYYSTCYDTTSKKNYYNYSGCVKGVENGDGTWTWTKLNGPNGLFWVNYTEGNYNKYFPILDGNGNIIEYNDASNIKALVEQDIRNESGSELTTAQFKDHEGSSFLQVYPVKGKDGYIYIVGNGAFRQYGIKLARVLPSNFENFYEYEYFVGLNSDNAPVWVKGVNGLRLLNNNVSITEIDSQSEINSFFGSSATQHPAWLSNASNMLQSGDPNQTIREVGYLCGNDTLSNSTNEGCGEQTCIYSEYYKKWIITYIRSGGPRAGIVYKIADNIWGPYDESRLLWTSPDYKILPKGQNGDYPLGTYGGLLNPSWVEDGGKTLYIIVKQLNNASPYYIYHTSVVKFVLTSYNVSFNANGGTGSMQEQLFVYQNMQKLTPNAFTRTGYNFAGWNTSANGSGVTYSDEQVVGDLTTTNEETVPLYAQWTPISYSITFNPNNNNSPVNGQAYTGSMANITNVRYNETIVLPANQFVIPGFEFSHWKYSKDGTWIDNLQPGASVKNLTAVDGKTVVVYAKWRVAEPSIEYVEISFNANGGVFDTSSISVIQGQSIAQTCEYEQSDVPNLIPTRVGYEFGGWQLNGEAFDENTVVNSAGTAIATWIPNTYSVQFNANGGLGSMANQEFGYGTYQNLTKNTFTRPGYTFEKWNKNSSGTGASYLDEQNVGNLTTTNNATVKLYAIWQPNTYTVHFDANGGLGSMADQEFTFDEYQNLTENTFTLSGYTFLRWNRTEDGSGTGYTDRQNVRNLTNSDNGVVVLYAQWTNNEYIIQFDANGGAGTMDDYVIEVGAQVSLTQNAFMKTGYTFLGWSNRPNSTTVIYTDKQTIRDLVAAGQTVILYAVWQANTYTVKFNSNGGLGTMSNQAFVYGEYQALTKNSFTRTGFNFAGWNTDKDDTEARFIDGQSVGNLTLESDITLYAIWTEGGGPVEPDKPKPDENNDNKSDDSSVWSKIASWFSGRWDEIKNWYNESSTAVKITLIGCTSAVGLFIICIILRPRKSKKRIKNTIKDEINEDNSKDDPKDKKPEENDLV